MKKLLSLTLAVMLVAVIAGSVFADPVYNRGPDARIKTVVNTYATTPASETSTIEVGINRIIGFTVYGSSAASGGLYDTTSATAAAAGTGVFAEASCAAGTSTTVMLPMPYELTSGLYTWTTNSGSVIIVYYE